MPAATSPSERGGGTGEGLGRRAAHSFVWAAASFGGSRLLLFVMTLGLTRLLAPRQFGVVAGGLTVITFLELGLDLGLGASIVYEQESGITARVQTAFTVNLVITVILTAVAMLAAPAIAGLFHAPGAVTLYQVLFLYLPLRGLGQVQDAVLKRDLGFRRRAGVELARSGVRAGLALLLAAAGAGPWSIVISLLVGESVATAMTWWAVRFWPTFALNRVAARQLVGFGLTVLALKVVDAAALDSDYVVVGARLGPTDLGYYTIGYRLPELLLFNLYWVFSTVSLPLYSRYRQRGGQALGQLMLRALRLITSVSFPAGVGLALVSRDAVLVLYGARWAPVAAPMALIALTTALGSIGYASGDIFTASGRPGTLLALNLPVTAALVVGLVLAAPYGIAAVAAVHLVVAACYAPVRMALAKRRVGTSLRAQAVALRPGTLAALGVLALAGPLRLLLDPGPGALAGVIVAGAVGAVTVVWLLDRSALVELVQLRHLLARQAAPVG